jgi:hypothetical protein
MSRLIFEGTDSGGNDELFISDADGLSFTEIVLNGGVPNGGVLGHQGDSNNSSGPDLLSYSGTDYLAAQVDGLYSLVAVNEGTKAVTVISGAIDGTSFGLDPDDFVGYGDRVYFAGDDDSPSNYSLWSTNGTSATKVANSPADPGQMTVYDNILYMESEGNLYSFNGKTFTDIKNNFDPTDLTSAGVGTYMWDPVTNKSDLLNGSAPQDLYMNAFENGKNGLFAYNGSGSPFEIYAGSASGGINPQDMQSVGTEIGVYFYGPNRGDLFQQNGVIFSGVDNNAGDRGLWISNGTSGGTTEIAKSSSFGTSNFDPYDITAEPAIVYFTANDGGNGGTGRGLFCYMPGFQGVQEVINSSQFDFDVDYNNNNSLGTGGFGDLNPNTLTVYDGNLFFNAAQEVQPGIYGTPQLYELGTLANGQATGTLVYSSNSDVGLSPTSLTHSR